jgi:hypothetical protein
MKRWQTATAQALDSAFDSVDHDLNLTIFYFIQTVSNWSGNLGYSTRLLFVCVHAR